MRTSILYTHLQNDIRALKEYRAVKPVAKPVDASKVPDKKHGPVDTFTPSAPKK